VFGQRLRAAGLLASMGTVGDSYDNTIIESFWSIKRVLQQHHVLRGYTVKVISC
jgi:transposase InsO family protein